MIAIANSDNVTSKVDLVIPANNRGRKSSCHGILATCTRGNEKTGHHKIGYGDEDAD